MTLSATKGLSEVEKIFKSLIWDQLLAVGQGALGLYVPFFRLPVIKQITNGIIGLVSDWIYSRLVLFIDVTAIRLLNSAHQDAFDKASLKLKVIAIEKGADSDEFLKARDEAKSALSQFTRLYGE